MSRDLNIVVRYTDKNTEHLIGDAAKEYTAMQPAQNFNDFAFLTDRYHADLLMDSNHEKPKYAFVWQDQILDAKQYMAVLPQNWDAGMTTAMRQQRAQNMDFLEKNCELMSREEVIAFVNHDYGYRDIKLEREGYHQAVMESGLSEREFRVAQISRNNPEPGDYNYGGYIMLNGEYTNVHTDAIRSPLQSYFEPGSNEYSHPAHAMISFADEGNVHWNPSRGELTISASHHITDAQQVALDEIMEHLNDDEREQLVVVVCDKEKGTMERYDREDIGQDYTPEVCDDVLNILNPMFKGKNRQKEYDYDCFTR
jgi:hypothetical protein